MSAPDRPDHDRERQRALDDLSRLRREPDVGASHMATAAPPDTEPRDTVEVWATRIGRGLAVLFLVGLILAFAAGYL
jgi:hypothetical protein